jgi:hypothetical protein
MKPKKLIWKEEKNGMLEGLCGYIKVKGEQKLTPEQRLWQLAEGLTMKVDRDKYPDSTFFFKGEDWWVEYDAKNNQLWCRYGKIWQVFETEYSMQYDDIQKLIKDVVEAHFKCKGLTPHFVWGGISRRWKSISNARD